MDNQFILRRADVSDMNALFQLRQKTFREAYIEDFSIVFSEKDLDTFFHSSTSLENITNSVIDSKRATWVVENKINGELVGYAMVDLCDFPHPDVQPNEDPLLSRLYIQRDQQNHGFGQQLMNIILSWTDEHYPGRPLWLGVWFKNFKAQKFYAYYGFNKFVEFDFYIGESKLHTIIMKRLTHIS